MREFLYDSLLIVLIFAGAMLCVLLGVIIKEITKE